VDTIKLYFDFNCNNWSNLLQKDIDAIAEWANMWQLNISISKTCMLLKCYSACILDVIMWTCTCQLSILMLSQL
jgi:hypothetical protein